jgi:hypothetical protein
MYFTRGAAIIPWQQPLPTDDEELQLIHSGALAMAYYPRSPLWFRILRDVPTIQPGGLTLTEEQIAEASRMGHHLPDRRPPRRQGRPTATPTRCWPSWTAAVHPAPRQRHRSRAAPSQAAADLRQPRHPRSEHRRPDCYWRVRLGRIRPVGRASGPPEPGGSSARAAYARTEIDGVQHVAAAGMTDPFPAGEPVSVRVLADRLRHGEAQLGVGGLVLVGQALVLGGHTSSQCQL